MLFQFGRTEMILNCLNPRFSKKFVIDYYFEMVQKLKFCVYDIDNNTYDLSDDDFLGELECTLGQVSFPTRAFANKLQRSHQVPCLCPPLCPGCLKQRDDPTAAAEEQEACGSRDNHCEGTECIDGFNIRLLKRFGF